jgi:hypothetical protein
MNNGFCHAVTESLMDRLEPDAPLDDRIRSLYHRVLARDPVDEEIALGRLFVSGSPGETTGAFNPWQFGYGSPGDDGKVQFVPLPHFAANAWQGGPQRPDPKLGWVILNSAGGHPGNDQQHMAIRRWVSPVSGVIRVSGVAQHPAEDGDGVRCRIVSSRQGETGRWIVRNGRTTTGVAAITVRAGDTIDFLTDCRTGPNHDSFEWMVSLRAISTSDPDRNREWNSRQGFHGPLLKPLTRWQQYAQTLLLTNEFLFLD